MTDARLPEHWLTDPRMDRLSDRAWRTFTGSLMWSASQGTDGWIPRTSMRWVHPEGVDEQTRGELVGAGLWVVGADGVSIQDWERSQSLAADVERQRERNRAKNKALRDRKRQATPSAPHVASVTERVTGHVTGHAGGQDRRGQARTGPAPLHPGKTDEEESVESLCERQAATLDVDFAKVRTAVGKACGRFPDPTDVMRIIATVLERATPPVKSGTALVLRSIQNDWAEWQKFLDESLAS